MHDVASYAGALYPKRTVPGRSTTRLCSRASKGIGPAAAEWDSMGFGRNIADSLADVSFGVEDLERLT